METARSCCEKGKDETPADPYFVIGSAGASLSL
jgi:hypothetical protein